MNLGEWKVQIVYQPSRLSNEVYICRRLSHGQEFLTKDGTSRVITEGGATNDNLYFAVLDDDQLQEFANALANKGVRTTNDSKNEGLLEATNNHLQDMRKLVFKGNI
jgi:hypothetical protein